MAVRLLDNTIIFSTVRQINLSNENVKIKLVFNKILEVLDKILYGIRVLLQISHLRKYPTRPRPRGLHFSRVTYL